MKKILGNSAKAAALVLAAMATAFAIRPDQGKAIGPEPVKSNPYREGFRKMQALSQADFLEPNESLQGNKLALQGDAAIQLLKRLNGRLKKLGSEVKVTSNEVDAKGNRHIRLMQFHQGLPVIGSDMVVHVNSSNAVYAVGGRLSPALVVPTSPKLKNDEARSRSRLALGVKSNAVDKQDPKLVIFDDALAYEVLIQDSGAVPALWRGYVDAQTGELLFRENRILHGAPVGGAAQTVRGNRLAGEDGAVTPIQGWRDNLSLYFLHNATNRWGVYDIDRGDWSQNSTGDWGVTDRAAISLAKNMETTQRYVTTVLGRNSFDNAGAFATAYAHEGTNYVNAYWNGSAFYFGDGDAVTANALTVLDVAAHEYGHAITQYTSNLAYSYESGALNESFSDIMGAAVEFWDQPDGRAQYPAGVDGRADYLMGEDCWLSAEALRDLRNPQRFGQPSYYGGTNWYTGSGDNGGVHYNSGVQNFAFYLLSEGGTGSNDGHSYNITGLGNQAAAAIALYANRYLLTSASQYRDAREAWILAATTLGYNAQTVRDVWTACGVLEQVNNLAVSPSSLNFGNVGAGSTAILNISLSNSGANSTTVTAFGFNNTAFSTTATFPFTVAGGATVQVPVRFLPPSQGSQSGQLVISSNADDNPSLSVALSGTGTAPAGISVTPLSLSGATAVGGTVATSLTVTNTGVADLVFTPRGVQNQSALPQAAQLNVLVLRAGDYFSTFEASVRASPNVRTLAVFEGSTATPTLAQLLAYDAVIVESGTSWLSPVGVGDVLANYVDAGGGVILMGASFYAGGGWTLQGRILTSTYAPLAPFTYTSGTATSVALANHPINQGVTTITSGLFTMSTAPQGTGISLGTFNNGYLVGAYNPSKPIVSLNAYPYSSYYSNSVVLQVSNALNHVAGGSWLSIAGEGVPVRVAQGSTANVPVTLDATQILGGSYTGSVELSHNVPGISNPLVVPVTFAVDGFRRLSATPSTLAFGSHWVGSTTPLTLTLSNGGDEVTTINSITSSNAAFSLVGAAPTSISGGQSLTVQVAFTPSAMGAHTGTLTVNSTAEDNAVIQVALTGTGTAAPAITVTPTTIDLTLQAGDVATREIRIDNTGGDVLTFDISANQADATLTARNQKINEWMLQTNFTEGFSATGSYQSPAQAKPSPQATGIQIAVYGSGVTSAIASFLNGAGYFATVVTDSQILAGNLSNYRVLVMAHNTSTLATGIRAAIETFVQGGGGLVTEWCSSTLLFSGVGPNPYYVQTPQWNWFSGTIGNGNYVATNTPIDIVETSHSLALGLPDPFTGGSATEFFYTVANHNSQQLTTVAQFTGHGGTWPALMTGKFGRGQVVLHLFDSGDDVTTAAIRQLWLNSIETAQVSRLSWMAFEPASGTIPAGGSQIVRLNLNTANLLGGLHQGELLIDHNAPGSPSPQPVAVNLTVDGMRRLSVAPASLSFGNRWEGTQSTLQARLINAGNEATTVTSLTMNNVEFSTTASLPLTVPPFDSVSVSVVFAPTNPGAETGILTIASNAEDNASLAVTLTGTGVPAPLAVVTPTSLTFSLSPSDAPADRTATLTNAGGDVLQYQIAGIDQTGSPLLRATVTPTPVLPDYAKIYAAENYSQEYAPGEVIVALKAGRQNFASQGILATLGTVAVKELATAKNPRNGLRAHVGRKLLLVKMDMPLGLSMANAIDQLKADANVEYAEPNYVRKLVAIPNDASFGNLYGMHNVGQAGGRVDADIDAPEAWDRHTGNKSLVLGLIDTGIDYLHPDLAANIWTNAAENSGTTGVDDDGNGFIDDIHGYDFINVDGNPMDDHYHGTHCAGTIGGVGNNGIGVAGVAWTANIAALKIFNSSGSTTDAAILNAVDYSNAMEMRITSNSWGGGPYSQSLFDLIAEGRDLGHLFIAAAGNNGSNTDVSANYPSGYNLDNIIAVAATDRNDLLASFSNYGALTVDLGAPGVETYSCAPGNSYQNLSGTSMATPHVSGAAFLVWTMNPMLTAAQVKGILLSSADPIASLAGRTVTGGRLNVAAALAEAGPSWLSAAPMTPGTVNPGGSQPLTITVNPTGLAAGAWTGVVRVATNDPGHTEIPITVTANISGCRSLSVTPTAFDFGSVLVGGSAQTTLTLRNTCNDVTTVSSLVSSHAAFTVAGALPIVLPAFGEVTVTANFRPTAAGAVAANVVFTSNADENPVQTLALTGTGLIPPHATVTPPNISRTLNPGQSTTVSLSIGNTGGAPLTWQLNNVTQGFLPDAPYDATHFVPMEKDQVDTRLGRPVVGASGGPDAAGYRWADSDEPGGPTFQWTDIRSTGTLLSTISACDDCYQLQALRFSFPFYGSNYNSTYITSNGYLTFGSATSQYSNYPLPSTSMPTNLVAAFFDDLYTSATGDVYFQDFGDHAIVQYQDVPRLSGDGTLTFQIVLHANGSIYLYFQTVTGNLLSGTTGIQNAARTVGLNVQYNAAYVKNGLAVRLSLLPPWVRASSLAGTVQPGESQNVDLTLSSAGLATGNYLQALTLTHNNPNEAAIAIPVTLTVGATSDALSRVLHIGPAALPVAAGGRYSLWNITVGGEVRGLARGSRYTLYLK